MIEPTKSYLRVSYRLRPAKQVERRMLLDAFRIMAEVGFRFSTYQYTGCGSYHFVDFILFHRLLGIRRLVSAEYSPDIARRVEFNRPFSLVEIRMAAIGDVIPTLSTEHPHILWLDYDHHLNHEDIVDISLAAAHLPHGSIILVTTDTEPPELDDSENRIKGPAEWMEYYQQVAGELMNPGLKASDFAYSKLVDVNLEIIRKAIQNGVAPRSGLSFAQLCTFEYKDGHRMATLGGMLVTPDEETMLADSRLSEVEYLRVNPDDQPFRIHVPTLTRREHLYLDSHMPCADGWSPDAFELEPEDVEAYRSIYRFYPLYAELLL